MRAPLVAMTGPVFVVAARGSGGGGPRPAQPTAGCSVSRRWLASMSCVAATIVVREYPSQAIRGRTSGLLTTARGSYWLFLPETHPASQSLDLDPDNE